MKTDLEVEVELDLRQLGKVLIFRYGRQGLAGSLGQGYSQAGTFWCVLNVSLRPHVLHPCLRQSSSTIGDHADTAIGPLHVNHLR